MSQIFNSQYFDIAYGEDYERRNPRYKWRSFLRKILKFRSCGNLLEVGCAFGLFLEEAREHFTCTGSDISDYAVSQARKLLPDDVLLYSGELDQIDIHLRFDVIACFDVLEHIADLNTALDNIEHLLNPGGLLVFTVPVYDGPVGRLVQKMDQDETHIHKEGRDFWLKLLNSTAFNTIYWAGVWRYFLFKRIYVNYVSQICRRWSPAVLVISKKGD
jgi:SAM-dependent methyltransferase